ncbi:MAG: hypothetical protein KDI62_12635, partial [Anaerolineae bacterium]|nr:hypothetical protein [Anaerolineae bacterium]
RQLPHPDPIRPRLPKMYYLELASFSSSLYKQIIKCQLIIKQAKNLANLVGSGKLKTTQIGL